MTPPSRRTGWGFAPVALEDGDEYWLLVMSVCDLLEQTDCRFRIGGFGDDAWVFDIRYDTSVLLEHLPELLDHLGRGEPFEVDLASQGVERTLTFSPAGTDIEIACASRTSWVPDPAVESLPGDRLLTMLTDLAHAFAESAEAVAPEVARLPPWCGWLGLER
ncbi:hypothetical protein ACIQNU_02910 [Streptomyces sp. NPDC091292]|uniref:hypothetical protein n=1 Tax=Streptomyces sp. NPDC091292 TaxID=3365991 RepID=UPI003810FE3C